jgi:predicted dehydrogenase
MSEPIRYGIVGLGRAGWDIHVKELRGRTDAKIVAVADPVEDRIAQAEAEFGCDTYPNINKLLKQDDVEVVVITSPSSLHGPDAKKAFRTGKHVIVEKPMALSVAEADSVIKLSEATQRKYFVHQNYRFNREFTHLKSIAASGQIGKLFHVRNYISDFARRNDWQTLAKNGGGLLNNNSVHFLDMVVQLIGGTVTQVMGDLKQIASAGDVEDHVKAFLRSNNGVTADIEISSAENINPPLPKWILCGTHGTLTSDGKTSTIRWFDPKDVAPLEVIEGAAPDRKYGNSDRLPWQAQTVPAIGPDVGTFYDNVSAVLRDGKPQHITPQSVRETMRVLAMIRKGTPFTGKPRKESQPAT